MKPRAIALLSGGLDSSVTMALARDEYEIMLALTFDYGQRASVREIGAARNLCKEFGIPHRVVELPWLGSITKTSLVNLGDAVPHVDEQGLDELGESSARAKQVWVPNRNGLLANIAACFADAMEAEAIVVGFNAEEGATFPDNTLAFVNTLNAAFRYSTLVHPTTISPTLPMHKQEIAQQAVRHGITSFWCCYHGGEKMCGRCESCVRTIRAFRAAGHLDSIAERFEGDIR